MKKQFLLAGAAAGLALACALPASAQSIDYGSLQELFNEPVTTSATGSPQRASGAPVDMDIISAEDIKRSGATDLPTILSRVAGVDIQAWSAGHADVGVRGYNQARSARLLVLINGRQTYLDHYGYTAWSTLPVRLEEIRQIEVVKGPNSALFGFNAVAGVVNIITYNPKFDEKGFATVAGGTQGYGEISLGHTVKLGDRFSARLTGGYSEQGEWKNTTGSPNRLFEDAERGTANLDTITQLADNLELRVEGSYTYAKQSDIISTYAYVPAKYHTNSVKGTLAWDSRFGLVQASAYQNDLSVRTEISSVPTLYENKIQVVSLQDLFKVGAKHTFRISAEYRKNEMPTAPVRTGKVSYDVKSISGMWNWQAADTLALTAAVRYDSLDLEREGTFPPGIPAYGNAFWDRSMDETTANVGVVWNATPADTFRASYARGVQLPTLVDLGGLQLVFNTPTFKGAFGGNPTLQPTVVTNYGVSYDRDLPALKTKLGVRLFVQKSEDIKGQPNQVQVDVPATATTLPIFTYLNIGESKMKGFELTAKGEADGGFHWSANWAYTDVEDDVLPGFNAATRYAAFAETTPKHRANLNLGWANDAWAVDGFARYESDKQLYYAGALRDVDAYVSVGGRVARDYAGLTFAVSGQNLLNERQRQTSGLEAERRLLVSVSKAW
jgi:iron complex outermembrane receptor protein